MSSKPFNKLNCNNKLVKNAEKEKNKYFCLLFLFDLFGGSFCIQANMYVCKWERRQSAVLCFEQRCVI